MGRSFKRYAYLHGLIQPGLLADMICSLKTQMTFVQHQEDELEQKRGHCTSQLTFRAFKLFTDGPISRHQSRRRFQECAPAPRKLRVEAVGDISLTAVALLLSDPDIFQDIHLGRRHESVPRQSIYTSSASLGGITAPTAPASPARAPQSRPPQATPRLSKGHHRFFDSNESFAHHSARCIIL